MTNSFGADFLQQLNQNLGIAHKVAGFYCIEKTDREDLIQDMMYHLWKSFGNFDGRSKFSTWMYKVCLNTALTYKKNSGKYQTQELGENHHAISGHTAMESREWNEILMRAIETLSPLNKAIVLLYLESMSYDEIAAITGLTRTNVSVRLVRIKKDLELKIKNL